MNEIRRDWRNFSAYQLAGLEPDIKQSQGYQSMGSGKRIIVLSLIILALLPSCGGGGGGGGGGSSSAALDTSGAIRLTWDASPDPSVVGYWVYYGTSSGIYQNYADTGPVSNTPLNFTLTGLAKGHTYCIVVSAYDQYRDESDFSNEVSGVAR